MRIGEIKRQTAETDISLCLELDGDGTSKISSGVGFFDHMLTLWSRHGLFDLQVSCCGDLQVDCHHSIEDIGICLGQAFAQAIGDKCGIKRYGSAYVPMDEALAFAAADISGRPFCVVDLPELAPMVGEYDTQMTEEFLRAFCVHAGITLHIKVLYGKNTHHILEAVFKAAGRALRVAAETDDRIKGVMSTKGSL